MLMICENFLFSCWEDDVGTINRYNERRVICDEQLIHGLIDYVGASRCIFAYVLSCVMYEKYACSIFCSIYGTIFMGCPEGYRNYHQRWRERR